MKFEDYPYVALVATFIATYFLPLLLDFSKTVVEALINFKREYKPVLYPLSSKICGFVIPCHNSERFIQSTLATIPYAYKVVCVANACTDKTVYLVEDTGRAEVLEFPDAGKMKAVIRGAIHLKRQGFTHFVLLDDDVQWPAQHNKVLVRDFLSPITALPVLPAKPVNWMVAVQCIEYMYMIVSKRAQGLLGNTIMASGAAGIYRIDTFLEAMRLHDGEHIGDDLQTAHIHHSLDLQIDFLPEILVRTHAPKTLKSWWHQRQKRWEISPVKNLRWIFKTIFAKHNVGWHIRWVASYRIAVGINDIARIVSLPAVILHFPGTLVGVWIIAYMGFIVKATTYYLLYPKYRYHFSLLMFFGIVTFPLYSALMWVSRIGALPQGIKNNFTKFGTFNSFITEELHKCENLS